MKKFNLLSVVFVLSLLMVGCASMNVVSEMSITDASAQYRDAMFEASGTIGLTEAQQKKSFESVSLPYLTARTEQAFPDFDFKNKLEKETTPYGDVYTLSGDKEDCIVFYIHGGAWVWEIAKEHLDFCDKLVDLLGAKVYMPIYPLAPQVTYEDSYEMVEYVYDQLLKQNKKIYIMGDSAGGTMTLGLVLSLKDKGKQLPDKVVVFGPCADARFSNPEINEIAKRDGLLPVYECRACAELWAAGADVTIPQISPLFGDFKGFPDTMMFIEDYDILWADELLMYEKMVDSKVNIHLVKGYGFWHVYPIFGIPEQKQCLDLIKNFISK